jgi:hypothetical protein
MLGGSLEEVGYIHRKRQEKTKIALDSASDK